MTLKIKYCNGIIALAVLFVSCSKPIRQPQPGDNGHSPEGFIYTMSNDEKGNSILCYRQHANGKLSYQSTTSSGGNGSGAGLGSQGSIVIEANHPWLYAVNAGSNSLSSFKISETGDLTLAHTVSSNGVMPISVAVNKNKLYAVNAGSSSISGYIIGSGGSLTPIPGSQLLLSSANAGAAEIKFSPNGRKLIVTEKNNNKITSYDVDAAGLANSPASVASAGQTPFGFDFAGDNTIIVTEASGGVPNASTVSSYSTPGYVTLTGGPISTHQTAACWAVATSDGRYAYITNTGSNTISSFKIGNSGNLALINAMEVTTGMTPVDIILNQDNLYVYNINAGSHSITEFKKGGNGTLTKIGELTGLPAHAVGIAAY